MTVEAGGGVRDEVHPEIEADGWVLSPALIEGCGVDLVPDFQSDQQIYRSRTRGTIESFLAILLGRKPWVAYQGVLKSKELTS